MMKVIYQLQKIVQKDKIRKDNYIIGKYSKKYKINLILKYQIVILLIKVVDTQSRDKNKLYLLWFQVKIIKIH